MNRREFGKTAGLVAVTAVVAPKILAEDIQVIPPSTSDDDWNKATPEQRAAIQRMWDNMPSHDLFRRVASEFPRQIPSGTDKVGFQHGASRILGCIDGHSVQEFEDGAVNGSVDLSNIGYVAMYRQAVRNKYTSEIKLFIATIPLDWAKETIPGQTIPINKRIPIGTSRVEITAMARESFAKLQELVVEYHNQAI